MPTFGPGSLTFGATGSELDVSCSVNSLTIEASKDQGDSRTMLCGTEKAGAIRYDYAMNGNLDTDTENPDGFFAFSQANAGQQVPFVFIPNTPTETSASGIAVIDPLNFGGEEYGEDMNSDIAFTLVGKPEYTYPDAVPPEALSRTVIHGSKKTGTATKDATAALERLKAKAGLAKTPPAPATTSKTPEPAGA